MWTRLLALPLALCVFVAPGALAKQKPPTQLVNINTASSDQLQQVLGIDPVRAQKICRCANPMAHLRSGMT
jgi:DNA uptake protein ComE-like DNA-binding protein